VAPFKNVIAWNETFKASWEQPAERAPIPHAELLTLRELAAQIPLELPVAIARLHAAGIREVDPNATVQSIAAQAGRSAQQTYEILRHSPAGDAAVAAGAGGGLGWKTLAQFCTEERIELTAARARLQANGIVAADAATLRELATQSGRKPYELVALLRSQP
jgi:hypothetical protein